MATSVWSGYLTFGLISVPLKLFSAARSEGLHFHQLHNECHSRLKQQLYCPTHERTVERSEIVKGYEYEKGQFVLVNDEELKKNAPASSRSMEILEFVDLAEVDPLYFDASYLAVPEEPGRKAYQLLVQTMEESHRAALAKLAMHQREYLVVIRPRANGLTLHTMYYTNEIRQVSEYGQNGDIKTKPEEVKLAKQLVESLVAEFDPQKYHDEYEQRLQALLDAKLKGQEVATAPEPRLSPVIDMMEALKKSLAAREAAPKKPPLRAVSPGAEKKAQKRAVR
jgi:DNA end-binding protein Ku